MLKIGCHLSASKGYTNMIKEAISIDANTFQFFTRNPRGGQAKNIDLQDVEEFLKLFKQYNFAKILAHAPYTLNLCSKDKKIREFAKNILKDDLNRMEYTPNNMYNLHPGSHVGQGVEVGIEYICEALNESINKNQTTQVLLETMAGKGSEIGRSFEELKNILDKIELKEKIGICLDTCHIYDAGYDIVNNLDIVLQKFDEIIGLEYLKAIHINDSKNPFESHKDRHEKIAEGTIGLNTFVNIINNPKLKELPFYLETPNELEEYKKEIKLLREKYIN